MTPRAVLTEALAAVYSGANEADADALLDQLADMGHTVCPDPSSGAGSIAAATAPGTPAGLSLGSPAGTSQQGTTAGASATTGEVEPTSSGSLPGAVLPAGGAGTASGPAGRVSDLCPACGGMAR